MTQWIIKKKHDMESGCGMLLEGLQEAGEGVVGYTLL